jgi:hypothetical protein
MALVRRALNFPFRRFPARAVGGGPDDALELLGGLLSRGGGSELDAAAQSAAEGGQPPEMRRREAAWKPILQEDAADADEPWEGAGPAEGGNEVDEAAQLAVPDPPQHSRS